MATPVVIKQAVLKARLDHIVVGLRDDRRCEQISVMCELSIRGPRRQGASLGGRPHWAYMHRSQAEAEVRAAASLCGGLYSQT